MNAPRRRLPPWLPFAGAAIGVAVLAVRLATLPYAEFGPFLLGLVVAVAVTVAIFGVRGARRRGRMRAAVAAFPHSLLIPIVVGVETAAASRWLAEHLRDVGLRLPADRSAIVAVDASGVRLLGGEAASGPLPVGMLSVLPLGTSRVGARRVDALVLGVSIGDTVAPLPLVPVRSSVFAFGSLTDAELLDVSARIRDALDGTPGPTGWDY